MKDRRQRVCFVKTCHHSVHHVHLNNYVVQLPLHELNADVRTYISTELHGLHKVFFIIIIKMETILN